MPANTKIIKDLTVGSVPKVLLTFAMPLFLSGLLQMVYNMVDMMVVGKFVGTEGLSAVAIGGEILQLITFVAMGFSNAGQILISRYVGENRKDKVGHMVGTLFTLLISLALLIMVIVLFTYKYILAWLNTPEEIWEYTRQYSLVCVCGIVFIYGYNLVSAIMRGMGDSRHPFLFIAIASVINVILDLLFVGVFRMGPFGAALATVIGQAVSFIFALTLLYRNREEIRFDFHPAHFRFYKEVTRPLLSLGIPMVIPRPSAETREPVSGTSATPASVGGDAFLAELQGRFTAALAAKALTMNNRIQVLSRLSLRGKLTAYFTELAAAQGSSVIRLPMNREDTAAYIGANRSALSRELAKMKEEGLIDYHKNQIRILTVR